MDENQFPMLSFQDSLNLFCGDQGENGQQSILEARNAAPFLHNYCVSPTEQVTENIQDPSPFKCGPIEMLNTPSPKKSRREVHVASKVLQKRSENTVCNMEEIVKNNSHTDVSSTHTLDGKKMKRRKLNHDNCVANAQITPKVKNEQGNSRMVMRFSDIRSGLSKATLSSDASTSEILQSRPMYKNISKTLFAEQDTSEQSEKPEIKSPIEVKPVKCKKFPISAEVNVETRQTRSVNDSKFKQAFTNHTTSVAHVNQERDHPGCGVQLPTNDQMSESSAEVPKLITTSNDGANIEELYTYAQTSIVSGDAACGSTNVTDAQQEINRTASQLSPVNIMYNNQTCVSWYNIYPTPQSSRSNCSAAFATTPQNSKPPECSTTYTPASICSETASSMFYSPEEVQQQQYSSQEGNQNSNLSEIDVNQFYPFDDADRYLRPEQIVVPPICLQNVANMIGGSNCCQFAADQTGVQTTASNVPQMAELHNSSGMRNSYPENRYFVPIPAATSPPTRISRKRKLIFEHIPTQQSSLKERIKYWEREGSLRTAGDPGLPGSRSVKVSKVKPGVIYCDTPPTEDEGSESEELYGAPKLLRMNPAKETTTTGNKNLHGNGEKCKVNDENQSSCPEVIEIPDDDDIGNLQEQRISADFHGESKLREDRKHSENQVNQQPTIRNVFVPLNVDAITRNTRITFNEGPVNMVGSDSVHGISAAGVDMIRPSIPSYNLAYSQQAMMQSFVGLPTPPSTPQLSTQQPLVQVLQFNPGLLHIQSLNVGGNPAMQTISSASTAIQQPHINAAHTCITTHPEQKQFKLVSTNADAIPFSTSNQHTAGSTTVVGAPPISTGVSFSTPLENGQKSGGIIAQPLPALSSAVQKSELTPVSRSENRTTQRPKYFDITRLQIGSFSVVNSDPSARRKVVLKLMFGKRKMVYEYEPVISKEDKTSNLQPVVSIEIPFGTIVGLKGFENTLIVEVNIRPMVHYGLKKLDGHMLANTAVCYERHRLEDSSNEQIMSVPYHQLQLRMPAAEKIKALLNASDSRFEIIQACPLVLMPSKVLSCTLEPLPSPPPPQRLDLKPREVPVSDSVPIQELQNCVDKCSTSISQPSAHQSLQDIVLTNMSAIVTPKKSRSRARPSGCMCSKGCRTARCRCVINLQECGPWCTCHKQDNCYNMLNQLADADIDVAEAKKDPCLVANLTRVSNLKKFLAQEVFLQCCNKVIGLKNCIPGKITCPGVACDKVYFFSWCSGIMCEEGNSWRKHCEDCRRCTAITNQHCKSCGHCHEKLPPNEMCPYSNRSAPQKLPMASFNDSVVSCNGKPTEYISISCGPLRSESYGKYVIGSQALGQKIKKLQEIDIIKSPQPVANVGNGTADQDIQDLNMKGSDTNVSQPTNASVSYASTDKGHSPFHPVSHNRSVSEVHISGGYSSDMRYKSIQSVSATGQTCHLDSDFGLPLHTTSPYTNIEPDSFMPGAGRSGAKQETDNQKVQKATDNVSSSRSKPKVSLLAQLLESENETENKILPRLLDSDDNTKDEKETPERKVQETSAKPCHKQATDHSINYGEFVPQSNEMSSNFIDGVLSYSDADKMLNMMIMPDLPDNLFSVDMSNEALDLECEKAIESIRMVTDHNRIFMADSNLQSEQQPNFNLDYQQATNRDGTSPNIDIHPHSNGVVDDFPDLLGQTPNVASPILANSLGKILGQPLDTSSPIPK